jgi:hypothetical protein
MKKAPNKRWKEISERLKEHLTSVEQLQNFIEELEKNKDNQHDGKTKQRT